MKLIANPNIEKRFSRKILEDLAKHIIIKEHNVILKNGEESSFYIDFKSSFCYYPHVITIRLASIIKELITENCPEKVFVAGKGISGLILTTMVASNFIGIYPIFIREGIRKYGIVKPIIGNIEEAKYYPTFIIDDVLTTGGTIREIKNSLENEGIKIKKAIVIVKRNPINIIDGLKVEEIFRIY